MGFQPPHSTQRPKQSPCLSAVIRRGCLLWLGAGSPLKRPSLFTKLCFRSMRLYWLILRIRSQFSFQERYEARCLAFAALHPLYKEAWKPAPVIAVLTVSFADGTSEQSEIRYGQEVRNNQPALWYAAGARILPSYRIPGNLFFRPALSGENARMAATSPFMAGNGSIQTERRLLQLKLSAVRSCLWPALQ